MVEFSYIGYNTESRTGINLVLGEDLKLNVVMREDTQALDEVVVVADKNPIYFKEVVTGAQEIILVRRWISCLRLTVLWMIS